MSPVSAGIRAAVTGPTPNRLVSVVPVAATRSLIWAAAAFTELVGTAIANVEAQAALVASRVRIVAAADQARQRIERDLHDGVQQRLVTLALRLRELQATAPPGAGDLVKDLDGVAAGLAAALEELRVIARGIHPTVLAEAGFPGLWRSWPAAAPSRLSCRCTG
jgi:signal transduction histidine kinase